MFMREKQPESSTQTKADLMYTTKGGGGLILIFDKKVIFN